MSRGELSTLQKQSHELIIAQILWLVPPRFTVMDHHGVLLRRLSRGLGQLPGATFPRSSEADEDR